MARVIPTLLCKDYELAEGLSFDGRRPVGSLTESTRCTPSTGTTSLPSSTSARP